MILVRDIVDRDRKSDQELVDDGADFSDPVSLQKHLENLCLSIFLSFFRICGCGQTTNVRSSLTFDHRVNAPRHHHHHHHHHEGCL